MPEDPVWIDVSRTFLNWSQTSGVGGALFTCDTIVTADITVYARWSDDTVYSNYDLNKDGRVSSLDLAICLLYVEYRITDSGWFINTKVNDIHGNPVFAYMCDFNEDNTVNMLDLIDIMLHYS